MARDRHAQDEYTRPVRRVLIGLLVVVLLAVFAVWRIDNPRVERLRSAAIDKILPSFEWALVPVTRAARMVEDFQSYTRIYEQNRELRRELQQMKSWQEAAIQLGQENARLLDLNKVRLNAQLTFHLAHRQQQPGADTHPAFRAKRAANRRQHFGAAC